MATISLGPLSRCWSRALLIACSLLLLPRGASAQLGTGSPVFGVSRRQVQPMVASPVGAVDPATITPNLPRILSKLEEGKMLTLDEYLDYIRAIERHPENQALIARKREETKDAKYPAQGWALIASRLHQHHYAADRLIKIGWIKLFIDGTENQGFEDISFYGSSPPRYVRAADGTLICASHFVTGPAALVMRKGEVRSTLMSHVNTGWGDSVQVASDRITGATKWVVGGVTLDEDQREKGGKEFSNAPRKKSPDQVEGNRLGNYARDYLQDDREDTLYAAMVYAKIMWEDRQRSRAR